MSDQRSAWPKGWPNVKLPEEVPVLVIRCLYQAWHVTKGQPDPKADQMSSWPEVVPLLATRCHNGGISDQRSAWPKDLRKSFNLTQSLIYRGGPSDLSARRTSENLNTLCILGLASLRFFLQKANKVQVHISCQWATVYTPEKNMCTQQAESLNHKQKCASHKLSDAKKMWWAFILIVSMN